MPDQEAAGKAPGESPRPEQDADAEQFRRRLEAVCDNATVALFILDEHQHCTYMNPAAEQLTGYTLAEMRGRPLHDVVQHTRPDAARDPLEDRPIDQAFPERNRMRGEETFVHKDGNFYPVAFTASPTGGGDVAVGTVVEVRGLAGEKRAEAELRASDERFRLVVESVKNYAIFSTDAAGGVTSWNAGAERVFGYTEAEIIGQSAAVIFTPEDREAGVPARELADAAETGRGEDERWHLRKDGRRFFASGTVTPIHDDAGKLRGFTKICRDITERRQIEDALREGEAKLRTLAENIPTLAWMADKDGWIFWYNKRWYEYTGTTSEQMAGWGWQSVHDPEVLPSVLERWKRSIATGEPFDMTFPLRGADGVFRPFLTRIVPIRDEAGQVVRWLGTNTDITEQRQAEAALRESETRWRTLLEAMPQLVWIDRAEDGSCVYMNSQWQVYTGVPLEELLGYRWLDHLHPDDRERTAAAWEAAVADKAVYDIEYRIRRHDGTYRWFKTRGVPVRDDDGAIAIWYGTCTDIDDQRRALEERALLLQSAEVARDEAQAANRMKDEFLATLSHELRTPLNAILGWARILRTGKVDPEDVAEGLEAIERNSTAQAQLIEDLLDISRIVSGNLRLDVQRVGLVEVIEAAIAAVMPAAEARGIRVIKVLDSLAGPVSGDPARLQQVVWNLLSNAVKFTPKGGRVQVLLERVNSHVEVSVIDTGIGIKPDFLPHVFDRFRQADGSTTRRHGGLGLGLAIVKQLAEMHGGSVRVKSPGEGQGATFTVMLPIAVVHPEHAGPEKARPKEPQGGELLCPVETLGGVRVLVVDDEPDARTLVKRVLCECHAQVETAPSAAEAIRLLERFQPHVLVSDIGMPEQDGYDLIRQVRHLGYSSKDLPAAALTAFARSEDRRRALLAGFQTHVSKPVDPNELMAVVASLAGRTGGD